MVRREGGFLHMLDFLTIKAMKEQHINVESSF